MRRRVSPPILGGEVPRKGRFLLDSKSPVKPARPPSTCVSSRPARPSIRAASSIWRMRSRPSMRTRNTIEESSSPSWISVHRKAVDVAPTRDDEAAVIVDTDTAEEVALLADVYADLKRKLAARGIPAREIRFVHG